MYEKMMKLDPSALTAEEHALKGVTKWRYLRWRDNTTSTSSLGFRIEGIMVRVKSTVVKAHLKQFQAASLLLSFYLCARQEEDGNVQRDFRNIQSLAEVTETLLCFTKSQLGILVSLLNYQCNCISIFITNSKCLTYQTIEPI